MFLGMSIGEFPSAPTITDLAQLKELSSIVGGLTNQLNDFISIDIPEFNKFLEEHKFKPLKAPKQLKL